MAKKSKDEEATENGRDPILDAIVKDLGTRLDSSKAVVSLMGDALFRAEPREWISFGIPALDMAVRDGRRGGGVPVGKGIEILGEEVTGKSLLVLMILREAMKAGGYSIYMDAEDASSRQFVKDVAGVNTDRLIHIEFDTLESGFESAMETIATIRQHDKDKLIACAFDSLPGRPCRAEVEAGIADEPRMAARAHAIRKGFTQMFERFSAERVAFIYTNHLVASMKAYGSPTTSLGGTAPRFFASVRLNVRGVGAIIKGKERIGQKVRATVIKTRFGSAWREVEYPIYSRDHAPLGVDSVETTLNFLYLRKALGDVKGRLVWEGKSYFMFQMVNLVREHPEMMVTLENMVSDAMMQGNIEMGDMGTSPDDASLVEAE